MTGLELLRQKWTMLNTERLFIDKTIKSISGSIDYYEGRKKDVQKEMDDLAEEINKIKG